MNIQQLIAEHDEIDMISDDILKLAKIETPRPKAASVILNNLAILVADHLRGEDTFIYPTILRERDGKDSGAADQIMDELEALKADWTEYLSDWSIECLEADWAAFCEETQDMLSRLKSRVRRETSLLYPLALRHGTIGLRAA